MTEADEAIERLTAQLNHLVSLESVGVMVKTTDLAAVLARAARVAELEAALKPLAQCEIPGESPRLPDDHGCRYYFSFGEIRRARAVLKEADQ